MVQFRQRVLESSCGIGKVYRNGRPVAEVQYRLVVTQDYQGMEQTPRGTDITGRVTVIDGSRDLGRGGSFTLELEDGRCYPITPQRGSRSSGAFEFNARSN